MLKNNLVVHSQVRLEKYYFSKIFKKFLLNFLILFLKIKNILNEIQAIAED